MTQRAEKGSQGLEVLHLSCLSASFLSTVGFCSDPSEAARHKSKMGCSLLFFESYVFQSSPFVFLSANVFTSASAEMLLFPAPCFPCLSLKHRRGAVTSPCFWKAGATLENAKKRLTCFAEFKESNGVAVIKNLLFRHWVNKSVPVSWLETVNVCFFLFADVIELKQEGKKNVFFLFNIYQNIISKRAAKRSRGDPISDGWEGYKNNKPVNGSRSSQERIKTASEITTWHFEELFNMLQLTRKLAIYPANWHGALLPVGCLLDH